MRCVVWLISMACLSAPTIAHSADGIDAGKAATLELESEHDSLDPGPSVPGVSYGTGFFVTRDGYVLTSSRVLEGCVATSVRDADGKYVAATVIAQNKISDLALLKTRTNVSAPAAFRTLPPKVGEAVVTFGYSISRLFNTTGHTTRGSVLVSDGLGGDQNKVQIAVPLLPSNNGGPLLDTGANIIGIVNMKRAVVPVTKDSHDVSEQVAFAIKAIVAANFLERQSISYLTSAPTPPLAAADFVKRAKAFTAVVQCRTGPSACDADAQRGGNGCNQSAKQSTTANSSAN